jgi:type I restriction enzyme S subunit
VKIFPESSYGFLPLTDCGEIITGTTPSKKNLDFWGGDIPFVTPAQLGEQSKILESNDFVTKEGANAGRILPRNTTLVCCIGSLGKTGIIHEDSICNQQINAVNFDKQIVNYKFGYYALNNLSNVLNHIASSTTLKIVNKSTFGKIQIPIPPMEEQKRIAAILDAADILRAKRRESLAKLDDLLQSTFLDMFGDPVTNPKCWEVSKLGDQCDVRDGTHDSPKYVEDGHPLLTSKNFKDGKINYDGANLISADDFNKVNQRSKVDIGDLVMPMIGTVGNPVLVESEPDFAIKNVALFKFAENSPDPNFIRALLCSHYFEHITSKTNRGASQKFVSLKDLRGMPIFLPPLDLQRRFAEIVSSVEEQKAKMRKHLKQLDDLFASLQQRAFRGDL